MRAIVYARVSTDAQAADGWSVDAQLDVCHKYATDRGWAVVEHVADDGVSGAVPFDERDGGARVLQAVIGAQVDVIVAARMDRLVRSLQLWADLVGLAADNDCLIVTADGAIDVDTSTGRLLSGVLAVVAAFERDLIAERTREGLAAARAAGVALGQRPHRADTLARVAELLRAGWGCRRITAALNGERWPRPNGSTVWTLGATRGAMRAATREGLTS